MGVDYNSIVFYETIDEKELKKLPIEVSDLLDEDYELTEGVFNKCELFTSAYSPDNNEFRGFGFVVSNISVFQDNDLHLLKIDVPDCIKNAFKKHNIEAKMYHFVYAW